MAASKQRAGTFGVEVILTNSSNNHPYCEHGPTLLFERFYGEGESKKFYACSACRDRKQCSYFHWQHERFTKIQLDAQTELKKRLHQNQLDQPDHLLLKASDFWCFQCNVGFTNKKKGAHEDHNHKTLTEHDLKNPSLFLSPKENNKSNAQYFFDKSSSEFLLRTVKKLDYQRVICIGAPRIFELIRQEEGITTILLDIDKRLGHFYGKECFLQYNMFNNYFFNTTNGEERLRELICDGDTDRTLMVVDPPFGGLVNILANTFRQIWKLGPSEMIDTFFIFPYFLESHVKDSLTNFNMLDYKVGYENHNVYNNDGKNKKGSPVRIFTNVKPEKVELPKDEYRFCKECKRYVYKANRHCNICNGCMSKDGRTYIHCEQCTKCVKPGWLHCTECKQCLPHDHKCSNNLKSKSACHVCGEKDHKRKDCPKRKGAISSESQTKACHKRKMKSKKHKAASKKNKI